VGRHGIAGNDRSIGGVLAGLLIEQGFEAALAQPGDQLGQQAGQLFFRGLADNCDANHAVPV